MDTGFKKKTDQFLTDLETIVNIDSGADSIAGIKKIANFFKHRFELIDLNVRVIKDEKTQIPV
jgi:acetylornithine deacetylase/succinyl-diaminopimelate desuccinylase-like protein